MILQGGYLYYCTAGTIRRTVWAGDHELYEIQAFGGQEDGSATAAQMENDTLPLVLPATQGPHGYWDPNPLFGRVAYVLGPTIDQPLGLVRLNMIDTAYNSTRVNWGPMSIAPHWNLRGRADLGTMGDGGAKVCLSPSSTRCMYPSWELQPFAFTQPVADSGRWFGTVIANKLDGVRLQFRRNRYVDPATGRFTQEDPLGLAGGLNLYGFAKGDPVNFSDPFGLCPPQDNNWTPACDKPLIDRSAATFFALYGAFGALKGIATAGLRALGGAFLEKEAASGAVSASDAIAGGLVKSGGKLASVLRGIEGEFGAAQPKSAMEALERPPGANGQKLGQIRGRAPARAPISAHLLAQPESSQSQCTYRYLATCFHIAKHTGRCETTEPG